MNSLTLKTLPNISADPRKTALRVAAVPILRSIKERCDVLAAGGAQ